MTREDFLQCCQHLNETKSYLIKYYRITEGFKTQQSGNTVSIPLSHSNGQNSVSRPKYFPLACFIKTMLDSFFETPFRAM